MQSQFSDHNIVLPMGVEIDKIDFSNLHNKFTLQNEILNLFYKHHLLILRNQKLDEEQFIKLSHIFGEPVPALVPTFRLEKYPVITQHTNSKDQNHAPKGVVAPEDVFHADSYFTSNPSKATLFYCLKAPSRGGETHFVNMCSVYNSIDEETKKFIADKKISYKNAYINQPPVKHPMIRVHPVSKQKALFVNKHRAIEIEGVEQNESLKLIEKLYHHATLPEFIYKHKWCNGDLLIWNNPTTMHCATSIPDSEERLLYRILTRGDLPVT